MEHLPLELKVLIYNSFDPKIKCYSMYILEQKKELIVLPFKTPLPLFFCRYGKSHIVFKEFGNECIDDDNDDDIDNLVRVIKTEFYIRESHIERLYFSIPFEDQNW